MTSMLNPGEIEGEVDHSFFDSDHDDATDGVDKMENDGLKAEEESPPAHESTDETENPLRPVINANNSSSTPERKADSCQSNEEEGSSRASNESPVASTSDKVIDKSGDREEHSNLQSNKHSGTFLELLAATREVDHKDENSQSPNDSEEEDASPCKHSKGRSPSPASTGSSIDADSESPCCNSRWRSSLDSPTLPRYDKQPSCSGVSRTRVGSAGSADVPVGSTSESEDTVTDVTPLSSPNISPLHSLDLNSTEEGRCDEEEQQQQQQEESVPSSGLGEDSYQDVDNCSSSSKSQLGGELVFFCRGGKNRKNYSFTNEQVRLIDLENQRLLRVLTQQSAGPKPGSAARKKSHMTSKRPLNRPSSSAVNRQREQQRIERENLIFQKRLDSVQSTDSLQRSKQLEEYQRLSRCTGATSYTVCVSTARRERSTSKTSSAGSRPASSALHSSRAVSSTSVSDKIPVTRSKKQSVTKPT